MEGLCVIARVVQLMEAGQLEKKMCAYTRKWRSFHEFLFVSSDRNNEPYTEDYPPLGVEVLYVGPVAPMSEQ